MSDTSTLKKVARLIAPIVSDLQARPVRPRVPRRHAARHHRHAPPAVDGRRRPRGHRPRHPPHRRASSTTTTRCPGTTRSRSPAPASSARCACRRHFQRELGKTVALRLRDIVTPRASARAPAAGRAGRRRRPGSDHPPRDRRHAQTERTVPYDQIDRAKTVFVWGPAPKPGQGTAEPKALPRREPPASRSGQEAARHETASRRALDEQSRHVRSRQMLANEKNISVDTLLQVLVDALATRLQAPPRRRRRGRGRGQPRHVRVHLHRVRRRRGRQLGQRARRHAEEGRDGPHRRPDLPPGDEPAHPRGRARPQVRGVREPRGRHRHRHHPADRRPLHPARPRSGREPAAARPSRCRSSAPSPAIA